jgi:hypothetical protein
MLNMSNNCCGCIRSSFTPTTVVPSMLTKLIVIVITRLRWESDVDREAWEYMRKKRRDIKVESTWRMATRSQTRATVEDQKQVSRIVLDDLRSSVGSSAQISHLC